MWVAKYTIPVPSARRSWIRDVVRDAVKELGDGELGVEISSVEDVQVEWTGYRKGVGRSAPRLDVGEREQYERLMGEVEEGSPVVLYFHGGAFWYVIAFLSLHWSMSLFALHFDVLSRIMLLLSIQSVLLNPFFQRLIWHEILIVAGSMARSKLYKFISIPQSVKAMNDTLFPVLQEYTLMNTNAVSWTQLPTEP